MDSSAIQHRLNLFLGAEWALCHLSCFYCYLSFFTASLFLVADFNSLLLSFCHFTSGGSSLFFPSLLSVTFSPSLSDHPSLQSSSIPLFSSPLSLYLSPVPIPSLYLLHLLSTASQSFIGFLSYSISDFFYLCFYLNLTSLSGSLCLLRSAWAPTSTLLFESQGHSVFVLCVQD